MTPLRNRLWAIAGGKGGVGKSVFSLLLSTGLAKRGVDVVLVDADLGGANLHALLGIRNPQFGLADFLEHRAESLTEIAEPTTIPGLRLINGADDVLGVANPKFAQKTRLLKHLERLPAEVVLLDLGAGTSTTALDFFLHAAGQIVVLTPQITSIQNAYGFIKASVFRKLARVFSRDSEVLEVIETAANGGNGTTLRSVADLRTAVSAMGEERAVEMARAMDDMDISLVLNMVREPRERDAARVVSSVAQRHLDISPDVLGVIEFDRRLERSINDMPKYLDSTEPSSTALALYDITSKVLDRVRGHLTPELLELDHSA